MNHDYAHCLDYNEQICPKTCFRARLTKDYLDSKAEFPVTWSKLWNTPSCELTKPKPTHADQIRAKTDEQLAEWIVRITSGYGYNGYDDEVKAWLVWMKQPAESEDDNGEA